MNEFSPQLDHLVPCETNIDLNKLGDGKGGNDQSKEYGEGNGGVY